MSAFAYYNPPHPLPGCDCQNCTHWYKITDNEVKIDTLIGLHNRVGQDDLHGHVLMHQGRPIQLLGMERVSNIVLLHLIPAQEHGFISPWDSFVYIWGEDVFTGQIKNFFSGTKAVFDIAPIKKTQYKVMSLNICGNTLVLGLFDVKTARKISYSVTETRWREQIVRLWVASMPRVYRPSLLYSLMSPLDPDTDSGAIEYVRNVSWTIPRYDTWSELATLLSNNRPQFPALMADLQYTTKHMNPNNRLFRLPEDIILCIVDWLEPDAQAVMRRVCRRFEKLIRRPVTVTVLEWMDEKKIDDIKIWEYQ